MDCWLFGFKALRKFNKKIPLIKGDKEGDQLSEGSGKSFMSKLDDVQDEYVEQRRVADSIEDEDLNAVDCDYRDSCYTFKFSTGKCPCELKR